MVIECRFVKCLSFIASDLHKGHIDSFELLAIKLISVIGQS